MAQETELLIEVSNDGITWTALDTKTTGSVSYNHTGLTGSSHKYYRVKAIGDGVTTSDSTYSDVVDATSSFCAEYQAVLTYAVANSIGTPTFIQNVKNDVIVRQLIKLGKWTSFDVFYYFKQETGTPYEFMTLNWRNPANFRLLNGGANAVSFVGGSGFKVAGSNNQYFNTQFNPSLHSVNFLTGNNSVIFSVFDQPTTYATVVRRFGATSVATNQFSSFSSSSGTISIKHFETIDGTSYNYTQANVNSHYQSSSLSGVKRLFMNGVEIQSLSTYTPTGVINATMDLFGTHYLGNHERSEGMVGLKYFALGSALMYNDRNIYKILNSTYTFLNTSPLGSLKFTTAGIALPSIYFPQIVRSSKFPTVTTTKKYIVLYSTDHSPSETSTPNAANGAIAWGECDHPNLSGFVERGVIISGYGSETPNLELVSADPDGQTVHLYYHPGTTHPDSGGLQQTRLITTTGGLLHTATWTDRGKVLGITAYETANYAQVHTGYLVTFKQPDNSFVGVHVVQGWNSNTATGIPKMGISTSINGRSWTRINESIDQTSYMPYFRQFHITRAFYFTRNATQYSVACDTPFDFDWTKTYISIARCDGNFNPLELLGNISAVDSGNGCGNAGFYIDDDSPDVLHIYYIMNKTDLYYTTWDLTNLD